MVININIDFREEFSLEINIISYEKKEIIIFNRIYIMLTNGLRYKLLKDFYENNKCTFK